MVISPNDFSLWSRLTGNKYPSTPKERAQKGPEVQRFIQNLGREGMLGGKENKKEKEDSNLGKKIAKGALIAGGTAATIAAARDPRVQETIKKAASATRNKIDDFLVNLGRAQKVDIDIVDASGDVTPDPSVQQSNTAPSQTSGPSFIERVEQKKAEIADSFKPAVEGETFQTSGAVGSEDVYGDIGDAKLRARRTFGPTIDAIKEMNPDRNVSRMGRQMLNQAQKDRDFDISYITARNSGMSDADAVQVARETAGFNPDVPVGKPTQYRKLLGTLKTSSPLKPRVDDLINLVETGQKVKLPEGAQEPGALVQISAGNMTPDNKAIKVGAEIGGPTLTDQQATKMAVDNVLDEAKERLNISGPVKITGIVSTGQRRTGAGVETAPTTPVGKLQEKNPSLAVTKLSRSGPAEPTKQLNLFNPQGDAIGPAQTQDEFIETQFSTNPADPTPKISGTVMPKNGESYRPAIGPTSDTMAARLGDIRLKNQQDLLSGNVSPEQAAALGGRLKSGLIYKNSPRLLQRDSEILTAAMVGEGAFKFGPEFTKMKQNLQLGADFPEILQDPSKETVSIAGEQLSRSDLERPAAFGPTSERLEERVQAQKDFRGSVRLDATSNMRALEAKAKNLKNLQARAADDGNTAFVERIDNELNKLRGSYQKQLSRIKGVTEKTEENIANLAAPKTINNPYGTGYKVDVKEADTKGFDKLKGRLETKIIPDFERRIETKREIDTGGFDMPEVVETGKKGGFSLQQPGVGRKVIGTKTSKQGIQYPVLSNERATGDMTAGSKPTGIAGDIQDIYRTGDPTTIRERVEKFKERLKTKQAGGITVEDIQDL